MERFERGQARVALMSIKPCFAAEIFEGRKRYEFRRVRVSLGPGDTVVVYESAPVSLVTGHFTVDSVCTGPPSEIAMLEGRKRARGYVISYLNGAVTASAIRLVDARKWAEAVTLSVATGLARPPQAYQFLAGETDGLLRPY